MNPCKIVQDLLPLYVEDICSPSSREYVEQHISKCDMCRTLHNAMTKRVQIIETQQVAKKSFAAFKRRMLLRRVLLIVLCAALSLTLLFFVLRQPIDRFLTEYHPVNIEFVESTVWRLSDGSIYIDLAHTEEYTGLSGYTCGPHPENKNILVIEPHYQRFHHMNNPAGNRELPHRLIVTTAESYPKYNSDNRTLNMLCQPYTCVILSSTDGERIIWQEGDELLPADQKGELALQFHIDHNHLIPISDESQISQ